jgi:hypothetical protein
VRSLTANPSSLHLRWSRPARDPIQIRVEARLTPIGLHPISLLVRAPDVSFIFYAGPTFPLPIARPLDR